MNSIAVIILNYLTWQETVQEVEAVKPLIAPYTHEIIVVDNCSPNDSAARLAEYAPGNFTLLLSDKNGGYAAGNNIGLRYALQKGHTYCWVLNNDIEFPQPDILQNLLSVFDRDAAIAVVSPDIYSPEGYLFNRDAAKPTVWDMTFGMFAYKKKGRAEEAAKEGWLYTYRPQGCCMLLHTAKCAQADFMDEYTFLYCEEVIFSERLARTGFRCACCSSARIIHNHSYTVRKALSKIKYIKANLRSFDYYLKTYRRFCLPVRWLCDCFYALKVAVLK